MAEHATGGGDTLTRLVQWFEEAEEANLEPRKLSFRDMDYYDGDQLTDDEKAALSRRGQPDTTFNFIGEKIDFMLGLEVQQRSDPKAWPRNQDDEEAAEAATDALRYVEEKEDLDTLLSESYEDLIKGGREALEVLVRETKSGKVEIDIKRPDFDRVFVDPHSSKRDYSDARYMGYILWWDRDQAVKKFPEKEHIIAGTIDEATNTKDYDDKPENIKWAKPGTRPRIRISTIYWQDGDQWMMTKYTKQGILQDNPVPFTDDEGMSVNPMLMQSAYVARDNARYGAIRRQIGPQDEENKRRSKLLHMLTVRQVVAEKGAVDDVATAQTELAKPDGYIEINPGMNFEVLDQSAQASGQANLMQYSAARMEQIGANASLQGNQQGEASGRAIIASQQGGIVSLTPLSERHRNFKKRVYEAIWQRIRQFWNEERWIRVTDNEDNIKFVGLNRKISIGEKLEEEMEANNMDEAEIQQEFQQLQQSNPDVNFDEMTTVNVPADMDMDINIETAPDTVTIQQEQFEKISDLIGTGLELNDQRMKLLIRASQLRNKDELLELIEGGDEPTKEQKFASQVELATLQANLDQLLAQVEKTQSETQKNRAGGIKMIAETDALDGELDGKAEGTVKKPKPTKKIIDVTKRDPEGRASRMEITES